MRAGLIVICHVGQQYVPAMMLAKHHDMVEYLPPDRPNQAFGVSVLPGRSRCSWSVANAHRAKPPDECLAISTIAIAKDIFRSSLPAPGLRHLPRNPLGCGACRHAEPHQATPLVPQNQKAVERPEGERRHYEEVHRR